MSSIAQIKSVSTKTVRFSAEEVNEQVRKRIEMLPAKGGISKEDWKRIADAVYKGFYQESPYLIDTSSLVLLEARAKKSLSPLETQPLEGNSCFSSIGEKRLKKIQNRVVGIYKQEFKKTQRNTLNKTKIVRFRELYFKMLHSSKGVSDQYIEFCERHLSEDHKGTSLDYRNIVVEMSMKRIGQIFEQYGILQLRPIDPKSKILMIGCGNGRTCDGGQRAFAFNDGTLSRSGTVGEYHRRYSLKHNHPRNIVTIDPNPHTNPTIVAFFGKTPLADLFEGKKFDRIIFEGYFNSKSPPYQKSDIEALLSEEGGIYLDQGKGPELLDKSYSL